MTWHTTSSARAQWVDAEQLSDELLTVLLDVAKTQVLAYAPTVPGLPESPPETYVFAQLRQAQNLWNAGQVQNTPDDFAPVTHPLDWHVKQILRPRRGVPNVG